MSRLVLSFIQCLYLLAMISASFYFEYVVKLTPCLLCVIQRFLVFSLLFFSFIILYKSYIRVKAVYCYIFSIFISLLGVLLALRHIWLQKSTAFLVNASCLPDISYMIKIMPLPEVLLQLVLHGGVGCSEVKWTLLGFSMPEWLLACYVLLIISYSIGLAMKREL